MEFVESTSWWASAPHEVGVDHLGEGMYILTPSYTWVGAQSRKSCCHACINSLKERDTKSWSVRIYANVKCPTLGYGKEMERICQNFCKNWISQKIQNVAWPTFAAPPGPSSKLIFHGQDSSSSYHQCNLDPVLNSGHPVGIKCAKHIWKWHVPDIPFSDGICSIPCFNMGIDPKLAGTSGIFVGFHGFSRRRLLGTSAGGQRCWAKGN